MGWTGRTFTDYRCWYVAVFPPALLIVLSIVVLSVIIMVCILYLLILRRAVQTVDKIREFKESSGYTNKAFSDDISTISISTTGSSVVNTIGMIHMKEKKYNIDINESHGGSSRVNLTCCRPKPANHPSKLKAVKTVLIVTLCFVGTWAPYYVAVIMFVKCDIMKNGYECIPLEVLTLGPLYLLGACNSLCDPIIYAWRHSGFKTNLWKIYWKFMRSRL